MILAPQILAPPQIFFPTMLWSNFGLVTLLINLRVNLSSSCWAFSEPALHDEHDGVNFVLVRSRHSKSEPLLLFSKKIYSLFEGED